MFFFNDVRQLDRTFNSSCADPDTPGCSPDTEFYTWRRLHNGTESPAPAKRALFCWAYDKDGDNLFIFGGVNYTNTFTSFAFYNDTWKFSFTSNTWTLLSVTNPPSARAGNSCSRIGNNMYMFGGAFLNPSRVSIALDEFWKFNINTFVWTFLGSKVQNTTSAPWPGARLQFNFLKLPRQDKIFLTDGFKEDVFGVAHPYNDVWVYDQSANSWTNLDNAGHPTIIREYMAAVALSNRYILFQGGDAQGNRTAADLCLPPLICFIAASPTDNTFIYDIKKEKFNELFLDHLPPPLRRAQATITNEAIVLMFGGFNFDGTNGVGPLRDRHTWTLEPKSKYLKDIDE